VDTRLRLVIDTRAREIAGFGFTASPALMPTMVSSPARFDIRPAANEAPLK
jgi:hypothetical protein